MHFCLVCEVRAYDSSFQIQRSKVSQVPPVYLFSSVHPASLHLMVQEGIFKQILAICQSSAHTHSCHYQWTLTCKCCCFLFFFSTQILLSRFLLVRNGPKSWFHPFSNEYNHMRAFLCFIKKIVSFLCSPACRVWQWNWKYKWNEHFSACEKKLISKSSSLPCSSKPLDHDFFAGKEGSVKITEYISKKTAETFIPRLSFKYQGSSDLSLQNNILLSGLF